MEYIIIDIYSGYIFADTRDMAGWEGGSIVEAVKMMDETIVGAHGRSYQEVSRLDGDSGYAVYRVDIDGSEAVTVVHDGQDKDTIDAVIENCEFVGHVAYDQPEN
ncbi:hypothetical protein [Paracoccus sp. (in: a-proteobacteria)]|uniref:hypothetical protein n=1 Tax=Paracoccus sp. TaxID=267 RepID=UPI0026E0ABBD|nr:hypothetical protein [Paracoccus sp. (in: a-proteobacteria)]MDO5648835.1 hypothetical protein [Paracoccus sp. (in: a-proteobacteria)]